MNQQQEYEHTATLLYIGRRLTELEALVNNANFEIYVFSVQPAKQVHVDIGNTQLFDRLLISVNIKTGVGSACLFQDNNDLAGDYHTLWFANISRFLSQMWATPRNIEDILDDMEMNMA